MSARTRVELGASAHIRATFLASAILAPRVALALGRVRRCVKVVQRRPRPAAERRLRDAYDHLLANESKSVRP